MTYLEQGDFVDTYPTAPAPLAAEASTELGAEQQPRIPRSREPISGWGVATVLVLLTSGIASVGALVNLAAWMGWLP